MNNDRLPWSAEDFHKVNGAIQGSVREFRDPARQVEGMDYEEPEVKGPSVFDSMVGWLYCLGTKIGL